MKNNRRLIILLPFIVLLSSNIIIIAQTVNVSNVEFKQRIDGSNNVDIYYDLQNSGGGIITVTMEVSNNNGSTWTFPCVMISGDVGSGITSGTSKHIVWDFAAEHPNKFEDQIRIKIIATILGLPCPGMATITDPRDGKIYNTVLIANQCWLKENMNIGTMLVGNQWPSNNGIIEKYCYDDNILNCSTYGGLYTWNEAMQYSLTPGTQGICPPGWHIPTQFELQELVNAVNNNGNLLKEIGQGQGNNISGFSALLSGIRWGTPSFSDLFLKTLLWSSNQYDIDNSISLHLQFDEYIHPLYASATGIVLGCSVRCLKNY